jgi:hypothetical protein
MHSFEVSLGYESVDQSTFSMKHGWKCSSINAFIPQWNFKRMHSILTKKRWSEPATWCLYNYITSVFHWNVTIWLVMKWSHDYKRDVSHLNETQIRTCTCLFPYYLRVECILLKFHWGMQALTKVHFQWSAVENVVRSNKIHNEKFNYINFWCDLNIIIRIECILLKFHWGMKALHHWSNSGGGDWISWISVLKK